MTDMKLCIAGCGDHHCHVCFCGYGGGHLWPEPAFQLHNNRNSKSALQKLLTVMLSCLGCTPYTTLQCRPALLSPLCLDVLHNMYTVRIIHCSVQISADSNTAIIVAALPLF